MIMIMMVKILKSTSRKLYVPKCTRVYFLIWFIYIPLYSFNNSYSRKEYRVHEPIININLNKRAIISKM